ncbi:MAG: 3-deoxy-manno-octulosonate cytidylyltransferase [Chthonomonas sp.]|nr:3-deoxy-manno-octulosonate cytidylyltransferase [Fimbriimonadaceae bacterium]
MKLAIVIPARMGSQRFPGKPLADLCGKPMVAWVYERAVASGVAEQVVVATPDDEILGACAARGIAAIRTRADHPSGTDRIAEAVIHLDCDAVINVQGDEPLIRPETIRSCAQPFFERSEAVMTSVFAWCGEDEIENPAVVKVVTDLDGRALYFSRYPIPFPRHPRSRPPKKHIGIYGYTRDVLRAFATWPPTCLEIAEGLEQLRFLEHGVAIHMAEGEGSELAVDTPEQADMVRRLLGGLVD